MEKKTISINNKIISYQSSGNGSAVVLLHGFGEDSAIWRELAGHLEHTYNVITPDIPGSGYSELTDNVSMDGIAEVVKAIIEAEGLGRVMLIGHSMGGYATLAFAEKYPQLLSGFGLFHSTALADSEEKKIARRKGIEFIKKYGTKAFLDMQPGNLFSKQSRENNPQLIKDFLNSYQEFSETTLTEYYEAMIARPDRTQILKYSKVPILFILGEKDRVIPIDTILPQIPLASVSNVHILKQSGHMGMLEEPIETQNAIDDFLSQITIGNSTI